jgi:hypothetical protein
MIHQIESIPADAWKAVLDATAIHRNSQTGAPTFKMGAITTFFKPTLVYASPRQHANICHLEQLRGNIGTINWEGSL